MQEWIAQNKIVDIRAIAADDPSIKKEILKAARYLVKREYHFKGKEIKTKSGDYRAAFQTDVDKEYDNLRFLVINGKKFSKEFCDFTENHFEKVRRKELYYVIYEFSRKKDKDLQKTLNNFLNKEGQVTPKEFFRLKDKIKGDFVGVYIIFNKSKHMFYVGQAKKVLSRVSNHFSGRGNGDVYADYKYGNIFYISIIKLTESGYEDIDQLERVMIERYDAYNSGYNKNAGNS